MSACRHAQTRQSAGCDGNAYDRLSSHLALSLSRSAVNSQLFVSLVSHDRAGARPRKNVLRGPFLGLEDLVVGVLLAYPTADTYAGRRHPGIALHDAPRFDERGRIVNRDLCFDRVVVNLAPPLHRLDLIGVVRLAALILATHQLGGMDDEAVGVPEADRIAIPQRIGLILRRVSPPIRVNAANV